VYVAISEEQLDVYSMLTGKDLEDCYKGPDWLLDILLKVRLSYKPKRYIIIIS